jgi:hypothetical protein
LASGALGVRCLGIGDIENDRRKTGHVMAWSIGPRVVKAISTGGCEFRLLVGKASVSRGYDAAMAAAAWALC